MKAAFGLTIVSFLAIMMVQPAFAQFQGGGVDKDGEWYLGEGLMHGDYFSYSMCHVDYKECVRFQMDFWIKGDVHSGTETKWLAEAVVYDGNKIIKGQIELGKIGAEPTGGSDKLGVYRGALKASVIWLSSFATSIEIGSDKGPKEFRATSWGKIANIGGEQIVPQKIEAVTVPAGTWETIQIGWRTGGANSKVWIVDDFPFPIKAKTFTHVNTGIPPTEYEFTLLEYKQGVKANPFEDVVPTSDVFAERGCQTDFVRENSLKRSTVNFEYQVHVFYGPSEPVKNCEMSWLVKFIRIHNDAEFLNQVQFDFLVVDDNLNPQRSIAHEEGRKFLYSQSGQYTLDMVVREDPGTVNYVVWIYGLAPEDLVPITPTDYVVFPITVSGSGKVVTPAPGGPASPVTSPASMIPEWVKINAGWWSEGAIDDGTFVQAIQFLIRQGIINIPLTSQSSDGGSQVIPEWVKINAGWWSEGAIDDGTFVQAIQFLIRQGIIAI